MGEVPHDMNRVEAHPESTDENSDPGKKGVNIGPGSGAPDVASRYTGVSWIVAALMAVAAAAGLGLDGLYRDNALVVAAWKGNDLVTLLLAVPLLVGGLIHAGRGSKRGHLITLGLLAYAAYSYAFYLFGAAFNHLFLVYVGVLAFSTLGLIGGLASGRLRPSARQLRIGRMDRVTGWLILAVAGTLGLFWTGTSLHFVVTGQVPAMVTATGHPTNVTGALDLWVVVTFGLLGGTWLIGRKPWGFLISVLWTVKGAVYMVALSAATVSAFLDGSVESLAQLGLWVPIGVACLFGAAVLLRPTGPLGDFE